MALDDGLFQFLLWTICPFRTRCVGALCKMLAVELAKNKPNARNFTVNEAPGIMVQIVCFLEEAQVSVAPIRLSDVGRIMDRAVMISSSANRVIGILRR